MKRDGNTFTLSTGRVIQANRGILGIDPEDGALTDGYDHELAGRNADTGQLYWLWDRGSTIDDEDDCPTMTPEERKEIALFMMSVWAKWGSGGVEFTSADVYAHADMKTQRISREDLLEMEIGRLRDALKPFADEAEMYTAKEGWTPDDDLVADELKIGHLWRAEHVLKNPRTGSGQE